MSIKLRFEKGSLLIQVTLKDEALADLMKIVSDYQSMDAPPPVDKPDLAGVLGAFKDSNDPSKDLVRAEFARSWLEKHSPAEILSQIGWPNFPEKILLLGAHIESKSGEAFESWRSADIEYAFESARETAPGNFSRDIGTAIKSGVVQQVTPRTYRLTRTGWQRVYEGIMKVAVKGELPNVEGWANQKLIN